MAEVKDYSAEALMKKESDVPLDIEDSNETVIELDQPEKKEELPNLDRGEVDLGGTAHTKEPEKKEELQIEETGEETKLVKEEVKLVKEEEKLVKEEEKLVKEEDNLVKHSDNYQKRIDKLTRKYREAERREKAALDFAKGLQKKYDTTVRKADTSEDQHLKEFDARVDAQREQVKNVLRDAIEKQDTDKIMEANDRLTQLAVEKEKARLEMGNREEQKKIKEEEVKSTTNVEANNLETQPTQQPITPKAKKWAEENTWFGDDEVMTNAAITIHNNLAQEGLELDSDEYYTEVNTRLRKYFPSSFGANDEPEKEKPKPVQTVASAGRKQQGRKTVKLSQSQVAIAKRLGVPLEEYARYVKEDN
jgi:hypothetical protein|tara:strand:+ start:1185 stop:2273 length:1089 start_codon:yes stop_codon:yes gene_type:complete